MSHALVVGEALVDIVRRPDGHVAEHAGGSPANVALGLARLDRAVTLATWFADDERGALLRDHLTGDGVHLAPGSEGAVRTSTALAELDDDGGAQYTFDLDWQVPPIDAQPDTALIHFGSIAATLRPGAADIQRLIAQGREFATVSYDPNLRPSIIGPADGVRAEIEALVAGADLVKVSEEDLQWLYPGADVARIARGWVDQRPAFVVVSRGGEGALGVTAREQVSVASPRVHVVDTVGAGDSYMSALLDAVWDAGLVGAHSRGALHQIDAATLTAAMQFAAKVAAITVSRAGSDPPRRAEVGSAVVPGGEA